MKKHKVEKIDLTILHIPKKTSHMPAFRLPRKTKKKLKKTIWLYAPDEKGNSLMAFPTRTQKDYDAYKRGELRDILAGNNKESRKKEKAILDNPIEVSDEELEQFVKNIFAQEYRRASFNTLIQAKNKAHAKVAYYNFINAYNLYQNGNEAYSNICCMTIDLAHKLLRKK